MRIKVGDPIAKESIDARFKPPVPQTDSGGQVENTKEIERIVVKELGKMPRNFGRRGPSILGLAPKAFGGRRD